LYTRFNRAKAEIECRKLDSVHVGNAEILRSLQPFGAAVMIASHDSIPGSASGVDCSYCLCPEFIAKGN
jgi:hypothetical protein